MKKKAFVKMKIWEDETSYNKAIQQAEDKINIVKKALEWCGKHIDIDKIDKKKSYDQIVKEANKKGLGKSGLVRMIVLKELSKEI